jgi:hypothetical protein
MKLNLFLYDPSVQKEALMILRLQVVNVNLV